MNGGNAQVVRGRNKQYSPVLLPGRPAPAPCARAASAPPPSAAPALPLPRHATQCGSAPRRLTRQRPLHRPLLHIHDAGDELQPVARRLPAPHTRTPRLSLPPRASPSRQPRPPASCCPAAGGPPRIACQARCSTVPRRNAPQTTAQLQPGQPGPRLLSAPPPPRAAARRSLPRAARTRQTRCRRGRSAAAAPAPPCSPPGPAPSPPAAQSSRPGSGQGRRCCQTGSAAGGGRAGRARGAAGAVVLERSESSRRPLDAALLSCRLRALGSQRQSQSKRQQGEKRTPGKFVPARPPCPGFTLPPPHRVHGQLQVDD